MKLDGKVALVTGATSGWSVTNAITSSTWAS